MKLLRLLAACIVLPVSCAEPDNTDSVRIGIAIPSYVHAVAWVTDEKGFLEREGCTSSINVMGGSAATMRTLIAGGIEIGIGGGDAVLKANLAGADLVVVAGLVDRFYHRLVVRSEIKTAEDLRGKSIGLPFLGGPQDMALKHALHSMGLSYNRDVRVLNMGKEFNRFAALLKGDIQGTMSQAPHSRLKKLGLRVLADLPSWNVSFPYAVVVVRRDYLLDNRETVRAFLKALCDGVRFYMDPSKKTECLEIIGHYITNVEMEGAAEERYRMGGPSLLSFPPYPRKEGFQMVLDTIKPDSKVPTELFDLDLLDEIFK